MRPSFLLRDELADALLVVKSRPYADPREEEFDDADYILHVLVKNAEGLKVWMMSHGLLEWDETYLRADV